MSPFGPLQVACALVGHLAVTSKLVWHEPKLSQSLYIQLVLQPHDTGTA